MADQFSGAGGFYPQGSFYEGLSNRLTTLEITVGTSLGAVSAAQQAQDAAAAANTAATNAQNVLDNVIAQTADIAATAAAEAAAEVDAAAAAALAAAQQAALDAVTAANAAGVYNLTTPQALTASQRGQARANIGGGVLAGFRNKIINGNFDIWQRGTSAIGNGFRADRWNVFLSAGSSMLQSRIDLSDADRAAIGAQDARYGLHIVIGDTTSRAVALQPIENVRTLAGKRATVTIWAKGSVTGIPLSAQLVQSFGSGGSPSSAVSTELPLSVSSPGLGMTKITAVVDVPSVAGKTFGSNENDYLGLQIQRLSGIVGNLTIARVSVVEGVATAEDDPFSPRHPQQEEALCMRYCEVLPATIFGGYQPTANFDTASWTFKVRKRATPAMVWGAGTTPNGRTANVDFAAATNAAGGSPAVGGGTIADAEL